jgi:hypothetical protein
VLVVGLLAGWPFVSGLLRRPPPLPEVLGALPPFTLVEPSGQKLDLEALAGRVWLVAFVDTGCVECAERLGGALERLQYRLRNVGSAAGILEVAVAAANPVLDPAGELSRHHANPRQWRVGTGPDARRLLGEVGALSLSRAPSLEAGGAVALVDAQGRLRAVEGVDTPASQDRLISKVSVLLNSH